MANDRLRAAARSLGRVYGAISCLPALLLRPAIRPPRLVAHGAWPDYLSERFNRRGLRILEIGSREVVSASLRSRFANADYIGFDFMDGPNVDVIGDVHKLSSYFTEPFDLIFSSAVFEHLHMPWVAAQEIRKVLKLGGHLLIETHFSFSSHERPWHFFQFSDMGLQALFGPATGFTVLDKGMSNPILGYFDHRSVGYLRYVPVPELYCHSEILCRKDREVTADWPSLDMDAVVNGTRYPEPRRSRRGEPLIR